MAEQKKLKVILLRHTLSPEETIALSAKLCYSKSTIEDLKEKISHLRIDEPLFVETVHLRNGKARKVTRRDDRRISDIAVCHPLHLVKLAVKPGNTVIRKRYDIL